MDVSGITWKGESIEDVELLRELPADLVRALSDTNGFILRGGAVPSEKVSSRRPRRLCLGKALMGLRDVRRISVFVLTLALPPGERGRLARCLWPPAKGVCYRGMMLELTVRSRLRTIRRDAEWCDRDGRAPQFLCSTWRCLLGSAGVSPAPVGVPPTARLPHPSAFHPSPVRSQ